MYYEKALSIQPRDGTVRLNLARAYVQAEKTPEAVAAYVELIKIDGKAWDAWYELGRLQTSIDPVAAKKTLSDLLSKNPDYPGKAEVKKILSGL